MVHRSAYTDGHDRVLRNRKHRWTVRAGARGRFEVGDVDSCCAPAGVGRRAEEKLSGGKTFNNLHSSAADRTVPV